MDHPNVTFMREAIDRAIQVDGVGSTLFNGNEPIARSTGAVTARPDTTAHAEMEVIRSGCQIVDSHHLEGCWLYTTHEPCPMCMAACCWAKIDGVVYAATQQDMPEYWASEFPSTTARNICTQALNPPQLIEEFLRDEALAIHEDRN